MLMSEHGNKDIKSLTHLQKDHEIQEKDYFKITAEESCGFYSVNKLIPNLKKQAEKHFQILIKINQGTFPSDKIVRLISNALKLTRNFNLANNLKTLEKLINQILQLRRLLRLNRLCLILRDYCGCLSKERLTKMDYYMVFFRGLLLYEDYHDFLTYAIQMKIINKQNLLPQLRTNISDLYFFECIGWLIYYSYEYFRSDTPQLKKRNRIAVIRYILDTIISHNDYSKRKGALNLKLISILGIVSSLLNLSLVWN